MKPSDGSLNRPAAFLTAKLPPSLRFVLRLTVGPVWGDHFDPSSRHGRVKLVEIVSLVANQFLRKIHRYHEIEQGFHQGALDEEEGGAEAGKEACEKALDALDKKPPGTSFDGWQPGLPSGKDLGPPIIDAIQY